MTVSGTVRLDLTDVPSQKQRHRVAALGEAPTGCRVVVIVGPLAVNPDAARIIRDHAHRLHLDVQGEPYAVRRWVEALRSDGGALL
jgi:hypothetical protein